MILVAVSRATDTFMNVTPRVLARDCRVTNTCCTDTVFSSVVMLTFVSVEITIATELLEVDVLVSLLVTGTFWPRLGRGIVMPPGRLPPSC